MVVRLGSTLINLRPRELIPAQIRALYQKFHGNQYEFSRRFRELGRA